MRSLRLPPMNQIYQATRAQHWVLVELLKDRAPPLTTRKNTLRSLERAGLIVHEGPTWLLTRTGEREAERAIVRLRSRST